ncbi:MAG: tRNA (adenosine(37)-N6)-threonylcarbamoyltransferase complex ATPase subunit type 1 TsaE [Deltaproteobacteria bacterium]|nr:tRNA (adenosine(37)-N6)-threonylcarbamoyltransferase complex ATPase subunit type 1 TsaE [Deltaproteobacteria bacterium]
MSQLTTCGAEETEEVGEALGRVAAAGLVVALQGPLGAGKTVFTKGVARGLDVPAPRYVSSPTFTIHKVYQGRLTLHHLDLYRLSNPGDLEDLGLDDALGGSSVCVIEWPDSFFGVLPQDRITVHLAVAPGDSRVIRIEASGAIAGGVLASFRKTLPKRFAREEWR